MLPKVKREPLAGLDREAVNWTVWARICSPRPVNAKVRRQRPPI